MNACHQYRNYEFPEDRTMRLFGVYFLILALGLQVATQAVAFMLDYQDALGWHVHGVYPFWGVVGWAFRFFRLDPDPFYLGASLGMFVYLYGVVYIATRRPKGRRYAKSCQSRRKRAVGR